MSDESELCFFCPNPASRSHEGQVSSDSDQPLEELIRDGEIRPVRGRITLRGAACPEHEDALADALLEVFGACAGRPLTGKTPAELCPDPFHTDSDNDGEEVGGFQRTGYRCPTCGFETAPPPREMDIGAPAYRFAVDAIANTFRDFRPNP